MPYTIQREDARRDLEAVRRAIRQSPLTVEAYDALTELADQIEEQVKPAVDEPLDFGSIVLAGGPLGNRMRWQRTPMHGKHYWESETGVVDVWSELTDVEVLRIGIGPDPLAQRETTLLNQQEVRDIASAVLSAMDVDQYLIDAVVNARPR